MNKLINLKQKKTPNKHILEFCSKTNMWCYSHWQGSEKIGWSALVGQRGQSGSHEIVEPLPPTAQPGAPDSPRSPNASPAAPAMWEANLQHVCPKSPCHTDCFSLPPFPSPTSMSLWLAGTGDLTSLNTLKSVRGDKTHPVLKGFAFPCYFKSCNFLFSSAALQVVSWVEWIGWQKDGQLLV